MLVRLLVLVVLGGALCASRVDAFSFTGTRWNSASATLHLQLGTPTAPLYDGFTTWGASAEDAIALWNAQLGTFRFNVQRDSTAARASGNRINNVYFSNTLNGQAWGSGVLAVTLTYSSGSSNTETDVIFNQQLSWDSYRGPQRRNALGQSVFDFHRVALHEFGHALGLDHPDENGQNVTALMNSRISSLDALAADDIAGGQALYGPAVAPAPAAPPVITSHPTSRAVTAGQSTTFSVVASSTLAMTYQWLKGTAPIAGATGSSYTISATTGADAGAYSVTVANSAGSVTSSPATLTVNAAPVAPVTPTAPTTPSSVAPQIVAQPAAQVVAAGQPVTFSVAANGTAPLTYQWRKDATAISGATGSSYVIGSAQPVHAGAYSVVVSNASGSVTSSPATLVVNLAPVITRQPVAQTVAPGARVTLAVAAAGTPAPRFQWFKAGAPLSGATSDTFVIEAASPGDEGLYHATATNAVGTATSASATITVLGLPVILAGPTPLTIDAGQRAQFSVTASGSPAPTFQWLRSGVAIVGATTSTFALEAAQPSDAGDYSVRVSNSQGSVTSAAAALSIRFSRLVNLSTRGFVPAGGSFTPGFYIRGAAAKPLLVRAVGPTLATFGVGSALGEARLDIIAQTSSQIVASNSDWAGSPALSNAFASVGAFPLAADSKDAAVQSDLAPAGYSVRIEPREPTASGITLAEIYDADSANSNGRLVNLSTLGFVGRGENVLTAGFVISGNAPKRLLIRAVGPGLAPFGVGNRLPDPQLGLVPLGRSEPLATNDDWPDLPNFAAAFTAAGAFSLPGGSKDAALLVTLEPGAYTVVVSDVSGTTTGNALVEIYDLDP